MKLVANGINKNFFRSLLPPAGTELDGVLAAIAYGDDKTELLDHCLKNHHRLDIWMRYDQSVPVAPSFLQKLLDNTKNNIFCKLIPDSLHSKVIWWVGYGAYIGSANLTDRAWNSNIEAGVFLSESDLIELGMVEQISEFFENLKSLSISVDLTSEIISEQRKFLEFKKLYLKEQSKLSFARKIPVWDGVNFVDQKTSSDKQRDNFSFEWQSAISIIRNISNQIKDFRPIWIKEDTPAFWQVDQFLHAYYYNQVRQADKTYPFEEFYQRNKSNPQAALISMLSWWKELASPPSNENITLEDYAPSIRRFLSRERINKLSVEDLQKVLRATHATMDHLIKMSASSLGMPNSTSLSKEERVPLFADWLFRQRNQKGQTVIELLNYVLYGGKPENMWERIYRAGKEDEFKFAHYGINSIAEVAGWARPEDTPPRNGRTNKALRALGYPVNVNF